MDGTAPMSEEDMAKVAADKIALEQALRDIAQTVIADADLAVALSDSPRVGAALDELSESMMDFGMQSPRYV